MEVFREILMITVLTHFLMSHPVPAAPYRAFCLEASACFWMCKVKPCLSSHPMGGLLKMQLILKAVHLGLGSISVRAVWVIPLHSFWAAYFPFSKIFSPLYTPDWHLYRNIYRWQSSCIAVIQNSFLYPCAPWTWHTYRWLHEKSLNLNLIFRSGWKICNIHLPLGKIETGVGWKTCSTISFSVNLGQVEFKTKGKTMPKSIFFTFFHFVNEMKRFLLRSKHRNQKKKKKTIGYCYSRFDPVDKLHLLNLLIIPA